MTMGCLWNWLPLLFYLVWTNVCYASSLYIILILERYLRKVKLLKTFAVSSSIKMGASSFWCVRKFRKKTEFDSPVRGCNWKGYLELFHLLADTIYLSGYIELTVLSVIFYLSGYIELTVLSVIYIKKGLRLD